MSDKKKRVVVIGNGMTSFRFCEKLLEYDAHHEYQLTVLGDELTPAYDRVALSTLFSGKTERDLILAEERWYQHYKIDLRLGSRATAINRQSKTVTTASGKTYEYDKLVIATGARPHIPKMDNTDLEGVYVYRTSDDAYRIRAHAERATDAVVIGGGLLGLEAAEACREMGVNTTIIEREPHLMACQLDATGGQMLDHKIEALKLKTRLGSQVLNLQGKNQVEALCLKGGEILPADLVILATGIQPNDELGREAGLAIGPRGGIAVDKTTRTDDSDIYAIGECASVNGLTFGLVAPCYAMAEATAAHLGGINKTYQPAAPASQLKLLDLQVASIGNTHPEPPEAKHVVEQDNERGVYKKLIMNPEATRLFGAILIGETSEFGRLQKCIDEQTALPEALSELLAPIGQPFAPELDLEDDDVVCFCSYVTKKDICNAIDTKQLKTTGDVMGATYAAGLCGSCLDVVDAVTKNHIARNEAKVRL